MSESLRSLSDQEIISRTDAIVVQDRKLTLKLLVHLREIERRKMYLAQGYSSMFDYCTVHPKPENAGSMLSRIRGKSRREVEKVVTELEPRAVLPPDRRGARPRRTPRGCAAGHCRRRQ